MPEGVIKKIVSEKGFGFIRHRDGTEWFFHKSAVQDHRWDDAREGDSVEFEEGEGPKGPRAERVRLL
jgi:CspA family cold shock protein